LKKITEKRNEALQSIPERSTGFSVRTWLQPTKSHRNKDFDIQEKIIRQSERELENLKAFMLNVFP
jgi:hypothetical protein